MSGRIETLLLRRSAAVRCAGAWESVHGHVESGEGAVEAAERELLEEAGLVAVRLYNLSRAEYFYLHRTDEVALIPAFAGVIDPEAVVALSREHDDYRWLGIDESLTILAWPGSGGRWRISRSSWAGETPAPLRTSSESADLGARH